MKIQMGPLVDWFSFYEEQCSLGHMQIAEINGSRLLYSKEDAEYLFVHTEQCSFGHMQK